MDSLLLLQFGSFLVTLVLALMLGLSRVNIKNPNGYYELSRWLMVISLVILASHYLLQMIFGFRAQGDDVGAVVNILFYSPVILLLSYSIINLSSGRKYRSRYLVVSALLYSGIVAAFLVGLITKRSLHIGIPLYVMDALLLAALVFAIGDPVNERIRVLKSVESNTAGDLFTYNTFMKTGTLLLFIFSALIPAIILSRTLLAIVGPLFLITLIIYVVNFICLGFDVHSVAGVLVSEENELPSTDDNKQDILTDADRIEIEQGIDVWLMRGGFANADASLDKLARNIDQPPKKLSQFISSTYGTTFRVWLSRIRLEEAKRMLIANPDAKIEAIAEDCGFTSRSYFQNLFKAETGFTPKEWRQKDVRL